MWFLYVIWYFLFKEFHEMSHGLLLWLENIDRRRNEVVPVPPDLDRETLRAHHKTLTVCSTLFIIKALKCTF